MHGLHNRRRCCSSRRRLQRAHQYQAYNRPLSRDRPDLERSQELRDCCSCRVGWCEPLEELVRVQEGCKETVVGNVGLCKHYAGSGANSHSFIGNASLQRIMRHSPLRTRCFVLLALSSMAAAQFTIEALSFGHLEDLSPNGQNIPGWSLAGEGHNPYIMSDRIVLTPPTPGNKRGGIWTEHPITYAEWEVVTEFRASGPERGSGNMQLWFSRDTAPMTAFRSVYTVDKFDGLVLQIDQYGGSGGKIRGFLNDGTTGYRNHHAVDSLAFGHCDYAYRNLGRMSKITLKQDHGGFQVFVDDKTCFSSSDVRLECWSTC